MTFLGISSSLAGAEPGRSGFPASYTSLLTSTPASVRKPVAGVFSGAVHGFHGKAQAWQR